MLKNYFEIDGNVFGNTVFTSDILIAVSGGIDYKGYITISENQELSGTNTLSGIVDTARTKVVDFSVDKGGNYASLVLEAEFKGLNDSVNIKSLGLTNKLPSFGSIGARVYNHAKVVGGVSPKNGNLTVKCVLFLRAESSDGLSADIERLAGYVFMFDWLENVEIKLHGKSGVRVINDKIWGGYTSVHFDGFDCDVVEITGLALLRSKAWENFEEAEGFASGNFAEASGSDLRFDGAFENRVQLPHSAVVVETSYSGMAEASPRTFYSDILNSDRVVLGGGGCAYSHLGNLYFAKAGSVFHIDLGEGGFIKDFAITADNILVSLVSEPPFIRAFDLGGGLKRVEVGGIENLTGVDSLYVSGLGKLLITKSTFAKADAIKEYQMAFTGGTLSLTHRADREFKRVRVISSAESQYRIYADFGSGSVGIYTGSGVSVAVNEAIRLLILNSTGAITIADKYITVKSGGARVYDIMSGELVVQGGDGGYIDVCRSPKYFIKNNGETLQLLNFNPVSGKTMTCFTKSHNGAHIVGCAVIDDICITKRHDGKVECCLMPVRHIAVKVGKIPGRSYLAKFSRRKFGGSGVRIGFKAE